MGLMCCNIGEVFRHRGMKLTIKATLLKVELLSYPQVLDSSISEVSCIQ